MSVSFKGTKSNPDGDFYCLNCLHSFRTNNKLKNYKNVCENYNYCHIEMPEENTKILKYNHGEKKHHFLLILI